MTPDQNQILARMALYLDHFVYHAAQGKVPQLTEENLIELQGLKDGITPSTPWMPIETAPKNGTKIWLRESKTAYLGGWYIHPQVSGWVADELDCSDYEFNPTHWMPA